jgi:hypothetical protein
LSKNTLILKKLFYHKKIISIITSLPFLCLFSIIL